MNSYHDAESVGRLVLDLTREPGAGVTVMTPGPGKGPIWAVRVHPDGRTDQATGPTLLTALTRVWQSWRNGVERGERAG